MNNTIAIDYLEALISDVELLKDGEEFSRHGYEAMLQLLGELSSYIEEKGN